MRERVEKVAPFLTVEADPYPAVVDGEIVWIVDGYTTTNDFPYSDRVNLGDATNDTYSGQGVANQPAEEINYIRSSVKAVVNAYDGSVKLYEFDEEDPILKAWNEIYGGDLITPKEETPETLEAHFRYPQDLFKIQRNLLQRYHVDEARTFIEGGEAWATPSDPSQAQPITQPAYYVYATYPEQEQPYFQLTSTFTPRNRENALASLMSGYYDENGDPQLRVYDVVGGDDQSVRQIHQIITSTSEVVTTLRDAQQAGTTVEWGNLLALPVGDGILYLEPMYLRRQAGGEGEDLPRLTNVAISYGGYVGFAPTFEDAVAMVVEKYVTGAPSEAEQNEGETDGEEPSERLRRRRPRLRRPRRRQTRRKSRPRSRTCSPRRRRTRRRRPPARTSKRARRSTPCSPPSTNCRPRERPRASNGLVPQLKSAAPGGHSAAGRCFVS